MKQEKPHSPLVLSVVVPVYNESIGLPHFHKSLVDVLETLPLDYEILYVDDGSLDRSAEIIQELSKENHRVRPVLLSRNFGKEVATTAGLHASSGNAALMLDADGQHPVELIPAFVQKWQEGAHVVIGVRESNQKEGFVKRYGSKLFYRLLRLLGVPEVVPGSTDFRLVDQEVLIAFNSLNEHNRITRSLIDWLGFHKDYISFHAKAREHGEATYSFHKLLRLALNGFVSLSFAPLYFSGYLGAFIVFLSFITGLVVVTEQYIFTDALHWNITGTALLALLILFLVGILLACQGLLAVYIARIYTEVQNRPLYLTKKSIRANR